MPLELHCCTRRRPIPLIERSRGNETRNPGRRCKDGRTLVGSYRNQGIQSRGLLRFKRNKRKREQLFQGAPESLPVLTQCRRPESNSFSLDRLTHKSGAIMTSPKQLASQNTFTMPKGLRLSSPLKITSAISPPRNALADCSPSTHRIAPETFDFPHPLGLALVATPSWKFRAVLSARDLNPNTVRFSRHII
jgi:hypothetical protein